MGDGAAFGGRCSLLLPMLSCFCRLSDRGLPTSFLTFVVVVECRRGGRLVVGEGNGCQLPSVPLGVSRLISKLTVWCCHAVRQPPAVGMTLSQFWFGSATTGNRATRPQWKMIRKMSWMNRHMPHASSWDIVCLADLGLQLPTIGEESSTLSKDFPSMVHYCFSLAF
jgi:hypothetical protein